jgi:hypothetical protein
LRRKYLQRQGGGGVVLGAGYANKNENMQMQLISPVNARRKEGMKGVVAVVLTSIGHERRCED